MNATASAMSNHPRPDTSHIMKAPHEEIIEANGVELCVEGFGEPSDPALLLIMGSSASMDWWEPELCEGLAAGQRFVIRYDLRDTGRSVSYEPGSPPYSLRDLADDAIGILDGLGIARAHVAGMSLGSGMAQLLALDQPERLLSLILIASSPAGSAPDLPSMSGETAAKFQMPDPDWSDREAVIEYIVRFEGICAGDAPFDEAEVRPCAARAFDRTTNIESMFTNHNRIDHGGSLRERLPEIDVPTLVIHGTEDPILPYEHGLVLQREIKGAELLTLEDTGHEIPRRTWDTMLPAILKHTER
jgi:pimeloyl-ACP methyl ester carboxylesterase